MSPHGVFRCAGEDNWIAIACEDDTQWRELAATVHADLLADLLADERFTTLADRKANEDELETIISDWAADKDRWAITKTLQTAGIPSFPTYSCQDVVEDPHFNERQFIERLNHAEVGERAHTGIPWRLQHRSNGVRSPAPCLGADTDRHLTDILGYDDDRLTALRLDGVIV